jgi:hypothetical protein
MRGRLFSSHTGTSVHGITSARLGKTLQGLMIYIYNALPQNSRLSQECIGTSAAVHAAGVPYLPEAPEHAKGRMDEMRLNGGTAAVLMGPQAQQSQQRTAPEDGTSAPAQEPMTTARSDAHPTTPIDPRPGTTEKQTDREDSRDTCKATPTMTGVS